MALEETAVAIVSRIDGKRTLAEIVDGLAADYNAPRDVIAGDVEAFLQELLERRMLEVSD
jgi:pyrroloquinoline quinone biosynthesis protein D